MSLSKGAKELRQLLGWSEDRGREDSKERKLADVLKERPDLIECVDEFMSYREHVMYEISHSSTTPAASHSIAQVFSQTQKQPKK